MTFSKQSLLWLALVVLTSCRVQPLLNDPHSSTIRALRATETTRSQPIRSDDKITISIWDHDDLSVGSVFTIYNTNESFGKWLLVDQSGNVMAPGIGPFHISGLTCIQAQDSLIKRYSMTLREPVVVVRVVNRQVTVLGEIRTPGSFILEKEQTTLAQVIGMAQGFTDFADKRRVAIVRDDVRYELDLSELDPQKAHGIMVLSGDVVTVPSRNYKALTQRAPIIIPFASAITAVALIISVTNLYR